MYTRLAGSVREDSYPFRITNETARAWDYVSRSATARENKKASRRGPRTGPANSDNENESEPEDISLDSLDKSLKPLRAARLSSHRGRVSHARSEHCCEKICDWQRE